MKLTFLSDFKKNPQISNFMKICLVWAELFHADRQTDMIKLTATLRRYAKESKKCFKTFTGFVWFFE